MVYYRIILYILGLSVFSLGITTTINVQHLGLHPWDVLNVGLFDKFGLTIGTWNIIIGCSLIVVSFILDRSYVRIGTFANAILVGVFVDLYLGLDFLPQATNTWTDIIIITVGIIVMGVGGGAYNAAGIGAGPRDGFMLSISDRTGISIGKMRIIIESLILVIGLIIGGPVFVVTFIFTFVQSPIFQFSYLRLSKVMERIEVRVGVRKSFAEK